jgi:hypothetical protein
VIRRSATRSLKGDAIAKAIAASGLSIYDDLAARPELIYDNETLESRLDEGLRGLELRYAPRTRAKVAKTAVAGLLGYQPPRSFAKKHPRFPGQDLDIYVQKANNLQIWNEQVSPSRRYALIRVDERDTVMAVRVLSGEAIALLDTTGTLTTKYQAKRRTGRAGTVLVTPRDTELFVVRLDPRSNISSRELEQITAVGAPRSGLVLTIAEVHRRLSQLVGKEIADPGLLQDRNRGVGLQKLAGSALGIATYADMGQFPDIRGQAVEVKLQLSPTIDLGLVTPDSEDAAPELGPDLRHCDVRYAIAYATRVRDNRVRIDAVVTSTGQGFFGEFQRFEGLVRNAKRQIPLPRGMFEAKRPPD